MDGDDEGAVSRRDGVEELGWIRVWGSLRRMLMHCDGCIVITGLTVVDGVGVHPGLKGLESGKPRLGGSLLYRHGTLIKGNHERRSKNPGKSFAIVGLNKKISSHLTPSPP